MALRYFINVLKSRRNPSRINTFLMRSYSAYGRFVKKDLFSRISPIGDPNQSVAPVLDKWVEEGNKVKGFDLKSIIRDLRSRRRYTHALQVSEWMSSKTEGFLTPADHALKLDLIGKVQGVDVAENYFNSLRDQDRVEKTYGALLNCYVRDCAADKSLSLLQKMKEMGYASTALTYNCEMCLYTNIGQLEKVPNVLSEMKEANISPDNFSYRICLSSYGARSDLDNMEDLLKEMEHLQHVSVDWSTYAVVANHFIKAGIKEKALIYLRKCEENVQRDSPGYNHLISLYASLGNCKEAKRLWALRKANRKRQSNKDYITVLGSLVKLGEIEEAEKLLREWEGSCEFYDFRVPNTLLIGYCQKGWPEKAEQMLRGIVKQGKTAIPNSWSIVAAGYVDKDNMEKAFECMKEALALQSQSKAWQPKTQVVSIILNWVKVNRANEVESFLSSLNTVPSFDQKTIDLWEMVSADGSNEDIMQEKNL
ncbi:pentatricopeptide repeat-containing protein At4g21705, mitochondrial-like [Syzygium oleosum]|uniref:pentatricopeptide repeat-containing protein At4g21705, mitochondrial-like n=1 Tax=Syzygium oleosum TaxID=219896 RepID=UPI0024B998BD|nr:pentatricopeptide repeat-containing protein At4g21705, mitochondrial-like [Syzygium oleosum]